MHDLKSGLHSTRPRSFPVSSSVVSRARAQFNSLDRRKTQMNQTASMKIGLYSITYLGCWYRGEALTLPELIRIAKEFGYDGVEFDGKRPHANPLDWPKHQCQELLRVAKGEGI